MRRVITVQTHLGYCIKRPYVKLVEKLEEAHCVGTIVVHKKGIPGGVRIKNVGANRLRVVVDFDGVQLVKRI